MTPVAALALLALAVPPSRAQVQTPPPSYLRLVELPEGLRLDVAVRVFRARRESGPDVLVSLVGTMHLAEAAYYGNSQAYLDRNEVVLYEQVVDDSTLPAQLSSAEGAQLSPTESARVAATRRRLALLLATAVRHHRARGGAPTLAQLAAAAQPREARRISRASTDAWGHPLRLETELAHGALSARVHSLGQDGVEGGTGAAADVTLEHPSPDSLAILESSSGLQGDLASAMGLVFQLEGIDYLGAHWRHSDVTLGELRELLAEEGADPSALLGALDGSSLLSRFAGGALRLVGATRRGRGMLRLVGLEILSRSGELFAAPPPGLEELLAVLIERRNEVVLADLQALLADEPGVARVAIFYGAGHMADLQRRITAELGLELVTVHWLQALSVRYAQTGMEREDIELLRGTIRRQLDALLGNAGGR